MVASPENSSSVPVALMWSNLKFSAATGLPFALVTSRPGHLKVTLPIEVSQWVTAGIWAIEKTAMMIR